MAVLRNRIQKSKRTTAEQDLVAFDVIAALVKLVRFEEVADFFWHAIIVN